MTSGPARGDFIYVDLGSTQGHEQSGKRPVLVMSSTAFNAKRGLAWVLPVTSNLKSPMAVPLPAGLSVTGAVLTDQLRSIDWPARGWTPLGVIDAKTLQIVEDHIAVILEIA